MLQESSYVSCNCNQTPTAVHWGLNNLICYASSYSIRIYNPEVGLGGKVTSTLVGHKKRVTSVRWIGGNVDYETELVSGSSDSNAIVWTLKDSVYVPFILCGHNSSISCVDGLYKSPERNDAIIVTISSDSTLKIWSRKFLLDDFVLLQNIDYGYSICIGVKLTFWSNINSVVIASAQDNSTIKLYTENKNVKNLLFEEWANLVGHEDWVRGMDFAINDDNHLFLASSSQDTYLRIWKIFPRESKVSDNTSKNFFFSKDGKFQIILDSVLSGHEGWIYSVSWSPNGLQLLSASLDKSMIIWELDKESNLWMEKIRVGEIGGNTLGFYGGLFGPDGKSILAHGYQGAFHIWKNNVELDQWEPQVTIGGHFMEVADLAWDPRGEFIITVSADQTSRIHAPWSDYHNNLSNEVTWHEIARPQVHGYDINSVAILSRYKFASAAEEKLIRTFQAPKSFVRNFRQICNAPDDEEGNLLMDSENLTPSNTVYLPSLGLSNKAAFINEDKEYHDESFKDITSKKPQSADYTAPPTEETLLENTLWPEIQKLYGHGYEVYALAPSPDGKFLASSCKSTNAEHSAILLWDQQSWKLVSKLMSHTLTVVQIAFSPDSQHLLSVSRDRRWSLFSKNLNGEFQLAATTDKKTSIHARIIWCCGWSHDSKYFATGSRDGKVVVWTENVAKTEKSVLGNYQHTSILEFKGESVTAVAFAPNLISALYVLAVGFESGNIKVYMGLPKDGSWKEILNLDKSLAHHLTVKRLAFRPCAGRAGFVDDKQNILQLASCSVDTSVRINDIIFD